MWPFDLLRKAPVAMPDLSGPRAEVDALESRKQELIAEVVEIGQRNEQRRRNLNGRDVAESYMAGTAALDITQWPTDHYGRPMVQGSSLSYRRMGAGPPVFRTEWDLTMIRELIRVVVATNETAISVLENLTNYVIGEGNNISAKPTDGAPEGLAEIAQEVLDEFFDRNDWDEFAVESFQRSVRDGETFRVLYDLGDGMAALRIAEPEQITQPAGPMQAELDRWLDISAQGMAWSFGVHADLDDAANVHGYFARWFPDKAEWDYLPGGNDPITPPNAAAFYCQHIKRNSQANVKRGISDFFNPRETLTGMKKLLTNYRDGAAIRAAIAYIRQMPAGVTKDAVQTMNSTATEYSITRQTPGGNVSQNERRMVSGLTVDIPNGMNYVEAPAAREDYEKVHDKCAEIVAGRWSAPSWFAGGTSDNVNYAAAFVAESPAVKYFARQQKFYCNNDRRLLWKVLEIAHGAGRFGSIEFDALRKAVVIQVEPPSLVVRDSLKETQRRQVLFDKAILSSHTWALQEDLDPEVEQENRKRDGDQTAEEMAAEQVDVQNEQAKNAKESVEAVAREAVAAHWGKDWLADISESQKPGRWVTIHGVHVLIGADGTIEKGPKDMVGKSPEDIKSEESKKGTWEILDGQHVFISHDGKILKTRKFMKPEPKIHTTPIDSKEQLRNLFESHPDNLYVRWSRGPEFDIKQRVSTDKQTGAKHAGLSAVKIEDDWFESDDRLARRLGEYVTTRLNDSKISPWIIVGEKRGVDTDGYDSIAIVGDVYPLGDALIKREDNAAT